MKTSGVRSGLEGADALARLLERIEAGAVRAGPDGYRQVVKQLQAALSEELPADALRAILSAYPTAAEVYENLHYERCGLARAPLERSVAAQLLARQAIARAASGR